MTHRALLLRGLALSAFVAAACGELRSGEDDAIVPDDPSAGFGDGGPGAVDAGAPSSADAGWNDATDGAAEDAGKGATGLDPGVVVPALGQEECSYPGSRSECPGLRPCRIATPDAGRCDDCTVAGWCGGVVETPCTTNRDCDVLAQCFRGVCTLFCTLPDGPECGGEPDTCVNVGHAAVGLCDPAKL